MAKACIKCGYVRRDSDSAPDYACPACGVVYAKAEAAHARDEAARRSAAMVASVPVRAGVAAKPDPVTGPGGPRADALIQQLALAQHGPRRPSPYRGMAMVALVAFALGFASAAGMYSAAAKFGKATPAKAAACPVR